MNASKSAEEISSLFQMLSGSLEKGNVPVYKHWPLANPSNDFYDILGIIKNNKQNLSEWKKRWCQILGFLMKSLRSYIFQNSELPWF